MAGVNTRSHDKNPPQQEELEIRNCGKCDIMVEIADKVVLCDLCRNWFHTRCESIDDGLCDMIMRYGQCGSKEMSWYCKICKHIASGIISEITHLKNWQEKSDKKFKDLDKKMTANEKQTTKNTKVMERCENKLTEMEEDLNQMKVNTGVTNAEEIKKEVNEMLQREQRRNRIVISNLTYTAAQPLNQKVCELVDKLQVPVEKVKEIRQLKDVNYVSVELDSYAVKIDLLRKSKSLKDMPEYRKVYIHPDLTYNQRQENKKLRAELKNREEGGEINLKIVKGKVVRVLPQQSLSPARSVQEPPLPFRPREDEANDTPC